VNGIVIDASVTLSWCFPDEHTLLVGERKGRITAEQTRAFFDALRVLKPALDYASLEQVAGPVQVICRDHRLTPYDALYVELALRSGCPLATLDHPQRQAQAISAFVAYDPSGSGPSKPDVKAPRQLIATPRRRDVPRSAPHS
jgi:predicted nucleic acid-binding protein